MKLPLPTLLLALIGGLLPMGLSPVFAQGPAPIPVAQLKKQDLQEQVSWINLKAIALAMDDMADLEGYDSEAAQKAYEELSALIQQGFQGLAYGDPKATQAAQRALQLKKDILFSHPTMAGGKIVATNYKLPEHARLLMASAWQREFAPPYAMGTANSNWASQVDSRRDGFQASIVEMSDLKGQVTQKQLYQAKNGSPIANLRLHWDGKRVLFTQTRDETKRWNIFELNLEGGPVKAMIENEEKDLDFFDGTYLPDGRIVANSNLGYNGVPCVSGSDSVANMVLYNPKDKSLRSLTYDQDSNWNPAVMNNGRVMYTRWEYTDLTHYYTRIVMHMNPDGTENKALYGSGSMFPNSTFDMQPLPGHSSAFIGVISGHHGVVRSGRLVLIDPMKSRKGAEAMVQEIPHRDRPVQEEIKDQLVNGVWPQFIAPSVISDKYFLVTAKLSPTSLWGIYLVDVFDNVTLVKEMENEGYMFPQLVRATAKPPVIPDRVNLADKEATFFIQDIYEGEGLQGVPRGTVKELRLFAYEYAYLQTASDHNWHGIQSGWDIKRTLGTVPVEEDGSVIFKAPANTPISIQPIDKEGVAIQWMRSWVVGQPGETVSCIGCHEDQNQIVIPKRVTASQKKPTALTLPEGGIRSFTFELEVQPILDRACIACHTGEGKAFDLRTGPVDRLGFGPSYLKLHPFVRRQGGEGDMAVLRPYEYHPNTSQLVRMLKKGHYNVQLTDAEWRKLYNWIDYNAPYKGYFNDNKVTKIPFKYHGGEQYNRRIELKNKYAQNTGVDWRKEIADYAAKLKAQGPISPVKPTAVARKEYAEPQIAGWPFSAEEAKAKQAQASAEKKVIELASGVQMSFVRIPAGQFVMGSSTGDPDAAPSFVAKIDKAFWMSELEVSNAQMRALIPSHDSKFIDQMWKDHVVAGYEANRPNQPAIRMSYNTAMEYCEKLSQKTGLQVTLPTEEQWEWACRAGSAEDFWYGNRNSDFGDKENLADKSTLKFAVTGIDPQPMGPNNGLYKHYTFLPKEESVDDGELVTVGGQHYKPNAFGLYNMHGNVAEWTRSDYRPYPLTGDKTQEASPYKVVRGGSYYERPKYSTAHTRKYYYPYQSVYNVGFRVIIEE